MNQQTDKSSGTEWTSPSLVESWSRLVQEAAKDARRMRDERPVEVELRAWRRNSLATLAAASDTYLRSPEFLRMLKVHIDRLIAAKRGSDPAEANATTSREQLCDDISVLSANLNGLQREVQWEDNSPNQADGASTGLKPEPTVLAEKAEIDKGWQSATPSEVVYRDGKLRLLHYRSHASKFSEPLLICFALVNRPYILDLKAKRSVVKHFVDCGFEVYMIDWGTPAPADCHLRLEDYIGRLLTGVVDFICERRGVQQVNLLGYCMGGTMSTIYTAMNPGRVRNLILMAAPIDFSAGEGLLSLWAREQTFDVDGLVDAFGNCPGEFLQFVFQLMRPVQNFLEKQVSLVENADDADFLEDFDTLEAWANDSIPVAGETFREFVKQLYQQNRLVAGQMYLAGERVRLKSITCPLLLLVAEKDHLVPPSSTLALKELTHSKDTACMSIHAGHIGLAVGSRAQNKLWPSVARWVADRSTELPEHDTAKVEQP